MVVEPQADSCQLEANPETLGDPGNSQWDAGVLYGKWMDDVTIFGSKQNTSC